MKFLDFLKHSRKSLGAKIFYLFTVSIVIIYFSFAAFFIYYQSKTLKQNLISEGEQLASLLAYNSRLGVFAENEDLLLDPIEGILQNKEVMLVQVFTSDGEELKTQRRPEGETFGKPVEQDFKKLEKTINSLRRSKSPFYSESDNEIEFWAPVLSSADYIEEEPLFFGEDSHWGKDNIIGFVRIILTTEMLKKSLHDLLLKSILMPIFFMIPGWIVIYFIVRGITKPLNRLTEGVKAIEAGGSVEKVASVKSKDEIGKLALAFNTMAESLKKKEAEKQKLEEQLRHSQKMEAIGTLAGGIAHDFNNILTGITGFGQLIQMTMSEDDPLRHHVQQILSSSKRGVNLTQSLLAFSRKQILTPEPVDVNEIIESVKSLLSRLIGEDIELRTVLIEKPLTVMADSGQIEQVLLNLATNARDAMPDGGVLTISTGLSELDRGFLSTSSYGEPTAYALISVMDTGSGMDKVMKEKIFDPFFTTKEVGKGTGLGLSMVYGIIKQHNGYIDVSSEPGKGTTFKIYLPLSKPVIKKQKSKNLPMPEGGTETVLVAEDDEAVRMLIKSILEQYGYNVIEARDGNDTVKKFIENKDKVKFLLLDVIMPKKNGKEVYKEIKRIRPEVKALFISGYTADVMHKKGILEKGINFIAKPVSPDKLLRKVREVLDK